MMGSGHEDAESGQGPWPPLRLASTIRPLVYGGRQLTDVLGRTDLPTWNVGESWEAYDTPDGTSFVAGGPFAGASLAELARHHPEALLGATRMQRFPAFVRFLDASGLGPPEVELGADGAVGTTSWHVLHATPGTVAHCGVRDGVDEATLEEALLDQDLDRVLRRVPLRSGSTLEIPTGTPYRFSPCALLYGVGPAGTRTVSAGRWDDVDGSVRAFADWRGSIKEMTAGCDWRSTPMTTAGISVDRTGAMDRVRLGHAAVLAPERWQLADNGDVTIEPGPAVLTNVGGPVVLLSTTGVTEVPPGRTVMLPAARQDLRLGGPADVLLTRL